MPYKISGSINDSARIIVIEESGWSVESNELNSPTSYEADTLASGTKLVIARANSGEVLAAGNIDSVYYAPLGDRGVFAGGHDGSVINTIEYITISTPGNAQDFGDLSGIRYLIDSCSNGGGDRGVFAKGYTGVTEVNIIEYITISTPGNATDFGDTVEIYYNGQGGESNGINDRGIFGGGQYPAAGTVDRIEYITISTTGNAIDFGDLFFASNGVAAASNRTLDRCLWGGGSTGYTDIIQYITISTPGNAADFGDLTVGRTSLSATSNGENDRAVWAGGYDGSRYNVIDYVTITTTGNATDFGDITEIKSSTSATSNAVNERGVTAGGYTGSYSNVIDYVTISTTGNATDFGDLTVATSGPASTSNA